MIRGDMRRSHETDELPIIYITENMITGLNFDKYFCHIKINIKTKIIFKKNSLIMKSKLFTS